MFICPVDECNGRSFPSQQGLSMHDLRVHQRKGSGYGAIERVECPECGKEVATTYIKKHNNLYHRKEGELVPVPRAPRSKRNLSKWQGDVAEFTVRVDQDGSMWLRMSPEQMFNLLNGVR